MTHPTPEERIRDAGTRSVTSCEAVPTPLLAESCGIAWGALSIATALLLSACEDTATTTTPAPAPIAAPSPAPQPPSEPANLRVAAVGEDYIEWSWDVVPGAAGYEVQFSLEEGFTADGEVIDVGPEALYRRAGLATATSAYLRVRSYVGVGDDRLQSGWTRAQSAMTLAPAPPTSYQLQTSALRLNWHALRFANNRNPVGGVHAVAYGDFDGDGDEDFFVAPLLWPPEPVGLPVEMYLNDGTGVFHVSDDIFVGRVPRLVHARKALSGDFNGDGRLDIFVAATGLDLPPFSGESFLLLVSSGNRLRQVRDLDHLVGRFHGAASGDIDRDGDLDIFVTDTQQAFLLLNDGAGNFQYDVSAVPLTLTQRQVHTVELIDVDDDGWPDLLIGGHEHQDAPTLIYWGDSSGTYHDARRTVLPAVEVQGVVVDIDAEDLDGDGNREIVLSRTGSDPFYEGYYIQIVGNRGGRQFADETSERIMDGADPHGRWLDWIRLQDVNDDGHLDIFIDSQSNHGMTWLNDGSGHMSCLVMPELKTRNKCPTALSR